MKNSQLAKKLYDVLKEKCEDMFSDQIEAGVGKLLRPAERGDHQVTSLTLRNKWTNYLESHGVKTRDYEDGDGAAEDLIDMINEGTDKILCYDPWSGIDEEYGGFQFLMVPKDLAFKIVALGWIPGNKTATSVHEA